MHLTYRYRVKNHLGFLNDQARKVNFVWNFCNDTQKSALLWDKKWPSAFDLMRLTAGSSKDLGLNANVIGEVCRQYAKSRAQRNRTHLRYRGKKSLGWVPLRGNRIYKALSGFRIFRTAFKVFNSRQLPEGVICDGSSFSQDARGNWFLNVCIEVADGTARAPLSAIGIDLGIKTLAVLSNGEKIENPRHLSNLAKRLATAQRAGKKRLARNLHAKVGNARRDFLHKESSRLIDEFDYIAVGNVNAAGFAKTNMAKSVSDAGWSSFRIMLRYKAIRRGAWYQETDEKFTTQVCSDCGSVSGPKGIAHLGIRAWICGDCGASHDRDVNSAKNILLRSGHRAPVEGIAA